MESLSGLPSDKFYLDEPEHLPEEPPRGLPSDIFYLTEPEILSNQSDSNVGYKSQIAKFALNLISGAKRFFGNRQVQAGATLLSAIFFTAAPLNSSEIKEIPPEPLQEAVTPVLEVTHTLKSQAEVAMGTDTRPFAQEIKQSLISARKYFPDINLTYEDIEMRIQVETPSLDPDVVSTQNAIGLGQITPATVQTILNNYPDLNFLEKGETIETALKKPGKNIEMLALVESFNRRWLADSMYDLSFETQRIFWAFSFHNGPNAAKKLLEQIKTRPGISREELARVEIGKMKKGSYGSETAKNIIKTEAVYTANNFSRENSGVDPKKVRKFAVGWSEKNSGEHLSTDTLQKVLGIQKFLGNF